MNIPSDVLYRWWLSFSKHSEVGQEVREYYLQALLEEANEPSRPASDFPVEKFVADTVPPPALTKSEKCVMPDDIKDRALALVQRYPELGALSGAWGNEVRALAREAEAAEKKWRSF